MGVLRSGRIAYTNDLPIYAAFDVGAVAYPGELHVAYPALLNAQLASGELDVSPISAFAYAQHTDTLTLLPDLCIGARREVWSVVCVSERPLRDLDGATIAVTEESASGRCLLRIILERALGVADLTYVPHADPLAAARAGMPTLLIGDRAIDARTTFPPEHVFDLGALWHEWTGFDMVFAVWAARREAVARDPGDVAAILDALRAARAWGVAHRADVIALAESVHARPPGFYEAYYRTLNFEFDARARAGLARFYAEAYALGALSTLPNVEPEVFRVAS